jgi:GNAT superfamily N-acetyltransferase
MLAVDDLDDTTVERAGALVAREQAAARQVRPELPAAFEDAGACAAALQRLRDSGYRGLVVADRGRTAAVMTAMVRATPTGGRYVRLPPEGFAVDPGLATVPGARGRGVGRALVDAALTWASDHGYSWISVDFETANPLSRPFWLNAGFRPAGYGVLRLIDRAPRQPGM